MDVRPAAKTISDLLNAHSSIGKVTVVPKALPFTPWSDGESLISTEKNSLISYRPYSEADWVST